MQAWCKIISWIIDVELEIRNKIEEGSWIRLIFSFKYGFLCRDTWSNMNCAIKEQLNCQLTSKIIDYDDHCFIHAAPTSSLIQPRSTSFNLIQPQHNTISSLSANGIAATSNGVAWAQRLGGVDPSSDCQHSTSCSSQTRVACDASL